ncbi:calcyphosin [Aphelenchoides avenae]|nr:calcyphosin [Aphelenchus avenae]
MNANRKALVEKAFKKLDKDGSGVVTVSDMNGVYDCSKHRAFLSGEKTKEQICAEFLKHFEANGHVDGKVTHQEFFDYYAGLSASIDADSYFDLMMRNAWKI